jgi:hypothetical protein
MASTQPFSQLTVSDSIANFIRKLRALQHAHTCSNAVLSSCVVYIMDTYVCDKCKFTLFIDLQLCDLRAEPSGIVSTQIYTETRPAVPELNHADRQTDMLSLHARAKSG